jgi:hypothetical protein
MIPYSNTQVSTYDTTSTNFIGAGRTSTEVVWKASYGQQKSVKWFNMKADKKTRPISSYILMFLERRSIGFYKF